jgi:DNA adenine methylase
MCQFDLFQEKREIRRGIVNVASVQKLSPFRYPGGKTWLVPYIYTWMRSLRAAPKVFIEPFAGGGIISLSIANQGLAEHIIMAEIDDEVASVWKTLCYGDVDWLIQRIISFNMNIEQVHAVLSIDYTSDEEKAFKTILKNRTFHGGILAKGSGLIKHGEKGKGIRSRWYPQTLAKRMTHIKRMRNNITFIHGDGFEVIKDNLNKNSVFFLDPPYTAGGKKAGGRLYTHHELDHELLFSLGSRMEYVLMTYAISDKIEHLARTYGFEVKEIPMKNTHNQEMKEYIISNDLHWV